MVSAQCWGCCQPLCQGCSPQTRCSIPPSMAQPLLRGSAETPVPPSVGLHPSALTALQPGTANRPLMQLRHVGCAQSSAATETLFPTSQQPRPTAAFPGMGLQRESKGGPIALPVVLDCVGADVCRITSQALLSATGAKSLPCSPMHLLGLGGPCSCLGSGSSWFPAQQG